MNIGITAADFSGNKGAAAMLQSIIKNTYSEENMYKLFSVYPNSDREQNPYDNLDIVSTKPEQIIFIAFPLAILFYIFKWCKPIKKLLLMNKILKNFYKCDLVVDAAGISFVDSRGFIMNTYNFICAATPILVGTRVVKFSQAMGPFNSFFNKLWAKLILPKLEVICARGEITKKQLEELGLKNIELCADGAFVMPDEEKATSYVNDIVNNDDFYKSKVIGLSLSSVVKGYCEKNNLDYNGIMIEFIEYLNNKGYGVLIIANAARKGKTKPKNNDLIVCQEIYDALKNKEKCRWYSEEFTPEVIREFISKTHILVASRFHAMIGALEKATPVLLVGWSHKYKEVLDMFNIGEFAIDYKKLELNRLIDEFEKLENQYDEVKEKIGRHLPEVKSSSIKNIEIINKLLAASKEKKTMFSKEEVDLLVGKFASSHIACSNKDDVREGSASGGFVSTLLIYLLENKLIDGAFVSRQSVNDGKINVESFIATTVEEILDCRTSIYTYFPLEKEFDKINDFKGNVAVVMLPCHLKMIEALSSKHPEKYKNIKYKISLFCGGVADDELMYKIMQKNNIDLSKVKRIYSRKGHWRGRTIIENIDNTIQTISYNKNWSCYKNAFFYSSKKCFSCQDHFGYGSDFSCGDIWLKEMKNEKYKYTAVITKNEAAEIIYQDMKKSKCVISKNFNISKIVDGNKRSIIYKFYTADARMKMGKKHDINFVGKPLYKSKWYHYVASYFATLNMRLSKNEKSANIVFMIPKKIMYLYMCFIRFLISYK